MGIGGGMGTIRAIPVHIYALQYGVAGIRVTTLLPSELFNVR